MGDNFQEYKISFLLAGHELKQFKIFSHVIKKLSWFW